MSKWQQVLPGMWTSSDGDQLFFKDGKFFGWDKTLAPLSPDQMPDFTKGDHNDPQV